MPVNILRAQRRAVLAYLVLHADRVTSASELIDALWGEAPPATARSQVQLAVSALRGVLRGFGVTAISSSPAGYRLAVAPETSDLAAFTHNIDAARRQVMDGRPVDAVSLLRAALDLWQGEPLAGISAPFVDPARAQLQDTRLGALESLADIELGLGRHAEIAETLSVHVAAFPLREKLAAQFIQALYLSGRRVEALTHYESVRRILADQLGVSPGQDLQKLHMSILRDELPAGVGVEPAQGVGIRALPADVPDFTGRADAIARLDDLLAGRAATAVISAVSGVGGLGKTALAVRWGRGVAAEFPDGQLYVNLRGYGPDESLARVDALARLLRGMGVAENAIPWDEEDAAALYRSTMYGKRTLLLLDNAASAEQVRGLLPGSPGNFVVVTSRDRLNGLIAHDGAKRVDLDLLSEGEAIGLIGRIIGSARVQAEPQAAAELVRLCGYLPLALRIAATNVDEHRDLSIAGYVRRLTEGIRLAELSVDGDPASAVRAVFEYSYKTLDAVRQRVFRLLCVIPGADVCVEAAADVVGLPVDVASAILRDLSEASLLTDLGNGRYTLHDLLRDYGMECSYRQDPGDVRETALHALMQWQLARVMGAVAQAFPKSLSLQTTLPQHPFAEQTAAIQWLDVERVNLLASIERAATWAKPQMSWLLACGLRPYLLRIRASYELENLAARLLELARTHGDEPAVACLHLARAEAMTMTGRYQQALGPAEASRSSAAAVGWLDAQIYALNVAGLSYAFLGRLQQAKRHLEVSAELGNDPSATTRRSSTLSRLGMVHGLLGDLPSAVQCLVEAAEHTRSEGGGPLLLTTPLSFLAVNYRLQGQHDLARQTVTQSLDLIDGLRSAFTEAHLRLQLAKIDRDVGDLVSARGHVRYALDVLGPSSDTLGLIHVKLTHASIVAESGDLEQAQLQVESALALARAANNHHNVVEALVCRGALSVRLGRRDDALRDAQEAREIAVGNQFQLLHGQSLDLEYEARRSRDPADPDAQQCRRRARELYRRCGHQPAPAPISWLTTLSWP